MKSLFRGLCLVLALMSTTGIVVAKDTTTATAVNKSEFADKVVNLNKADANTLRYYLKGIGEVKANAIIQYRKDNGKFSSIDDLLKVSGIGEATFKGLKKNVSTSRGETTAPKQLPTSGKAAKSKSATKKSSLLDKSDGDGKPAKSKAKDNKSTLKADAKKDKKAAKDDTSKLKPAKTKKSTDSQSKANKKSKTAACDPAKDKDCKTKASKKKTPKAKKATKSKTDKTKKSSAKSKSATKKPKTKAKKSTSKSKSKAKKSTSKSKDKKKKTTTK